MSRRSDVHHTGYLRRLGIIEQLARSTNGALEAEALTDPNTFHGGHTPCFCAASRVPAAYAAAANHYAEMRKVERRTACDARLSA